MIGCSHHHTPLHLRQRLAFTPEQTRQALGSLKSHCPGIEAVLLSTCNRVELYAAGADANSIPNVGYLRQFILDFHHQSPSDYEQHLKNCSDAQAIEHLFTVASSLDSLIVGESQILSQVKQAYEVSNSIELAGPIVHSAFQHANHVAKRVTNETEIHSKRISVPSVAISEIATEFFERLDDKDILIIGTGEMGEESLRYLHAAGAKRVTLINRSAERAHQLAEMFNQEFYGSLVISTQDWDHLGSCLMVADLVISTTAASEPIMTLEDYQVLHDRRKKKGTQLILDLAVPRDFDDRIGQLPQVYLYSVDDLQKVCDRNLDFRRQQWPIAKKIISEETIRFIGDVQHRQTGPTIQALREQVEQIKQAELDRLRNRLTNHTISTEAFDEVSQTLERVVNKILHSPLQSLREESTTGDHATLLSALKRLFKIQD
ncbi:MAG: glutamyl-tRNA reductase [Pirellulaceae bacterium]|nr:glutamyl-tRNA reductase [Pirellulaceae bacterium]